jgi:hypothetical protein
MSRWKMLNKRNKHFDSSRGMSPQPNLFISQTKINLVCEFFFNFSIFGRKANFLLFADFACLLKRFVQRKEDLVILLLAAILLPQFLVII